MTMYSKEAMGYLYDPKKKYFQVVVELEQESGALASICSAFAAANINLLSGFTSISPEGKSAIFSTFVEADNVLVTASDIRRAVDSCKFAIKSRINESSSGLPVNTFHLPLTTTPGNYSILMSVKALSHMFKEVRESFGSGGSAILYYEGLAVGRSWVESLTHRTGKESGLGRLNELFQIYHASGWGMMDLVSEQPDLSEAVIRVWNGFECSGQTATTAYSQFMRGMINGSCRALSNLATECTEVKCVAVGDRYCEFWVHGGSLRE